MDASTWTLRRRLQDVDLEGQLYVDWIMKRAARECSSRVGRWSRDEVDAVRWFLRHGIIARPCPCTSLRLSCPTPAVWIWRSFASFRRSIVISYRRGEDGSAYSDGARCHPRSGRQLRRSEGAGRSGGRPQPMRACVLINGKCVKRYARTFRDVCIIEMRSTMR